MPLIAIENIRKAFADPAGGQVSALDGVSLAVAESEFFTLLGPSGCGKTTLLRIVAGFEHPDSGRVLLDGKDLARLPPDHRPVNTVFQNYALFPHMTAAENIAFGLRMRGVGGDEVKRTVGEMLSLVKLKDLGGRRPSQLSGGQQQRIALARALANRPRVLLLDEPLSALDFKLRKAMQVELKRLQRETAVTFVFVTHDQSEALAMSDRIAVMSAGKVRQVGPPAEIYERPADRFVADFIGETNFIDVNILSRENNYASCRFAEGGEIALPISALPAPPASACTLAIRPERVRIGEFKLRGELKEIVYQGDATRYHIKLKDGPILSALISGGDSSRIIKRGDVVGVEFPFDALRVLK